MRSAMKNFWILAIIFSLSFLLVFIAPDAFKGLALAPGVGALVFALFQIFRDYTAHERQKELSHRNELLNLSVSSHMSTVAFDKHVEFCEKYLKCMRDIVDDLIVHGATGDDKRVWMLYSLRYEYCLWLPGDMMSRLEEIELKIRRAQSSERSSSRLKDSDVHRDLYEKYIDDASRLTMEIIGYEGSASSLQDVVSELKRLLDAEKLYKLKQGVIDSIVDSKLMLKK